MPLEETVTTQTAVASAATTNGTIREDMTMRATTESRALTSTRSAGRG
jgi:hypothetical protein